MRRYMRFFSRDPRKKKLFFCIAAAILVLALSGTAFAANGKPSGATPSQTMLATILSAIVACVFLTIGILLAMRKDEMHLSNGWQMFLFAAVCAAGLRLIAAAIYPGYGSDLACFTGWSDAVYKYGFSGLYTSSDVFIDYPPGYMYVLYVIGFIKSALGIGYSSALSVILIKTPAIIADMMIAIILYRIASREENRMFGLLCSCLVLFNPAVFFDTAVWAQMDSVFILFVVLNIYYLRQERYILGAVFFAVALLVKPQAVMFLPVVGLAYFYALFKRGGFGKAVGGIFGGLLAGAAVFAAGVLPFMLESVSPFAFNQDPSWIVGKYIGTMQSYRYYTLNAFNLYAAAGGNWLSFDAPFLSFEYRVWMSASIVLICVAVIVLQWRSREKRRLFEIAAFLIISLFMLAPMMHERYILPACVLTLFAYAYSRDLVTLFFGCAFSFTALINQMVVLFGDSTAAAPLPALIFSAANLGLYAAYAALTAKKLSSGRVLIKSPGLLG